jgi:signal transduction histidine kinase
LIEILVSNLLNNAIRYGTKGETITVSIDDRTLAISNKGAPVKMKIEQMTQRFTKESADTNSTGLGLAIVKKICDSYFYTLQHSYADGTHTFTIIF